jgi:hypothetical protein
MDLHFYLHIGDGKTGTSAIQNFLDINRKELLKRTGTLYPNFFATSFEEGHCHDHIGWFTPYQENPDAIITDLTRLYDHCQQHNISRIILSNEGWVGKPGMGFIEILKSWKTHHPQVIIHPICYVRRHDHYIESYWKQWGLKAFETIEEAIAFNLTQPRKEKVHNSLLAWEQVSDRQHIKVRPYEKEQLKDGLIADFLSCVGIDHMAHEWKQVEASNLAMNVGFNRDVLEVLHYCRELYSDVNDNRLFDLFFELLNEKYQKKPFESYAILSPKQRLRILRETDPIMQHIARRYMGRDDGRLFFEPWPCEDEPWQPYEGLTLERFIPILISMIQSQQQELRQIKEAFNKN